MGILVGLPIICVFLLWSQAVWSHMGLATAHGSFLVDGWRAWNNATVFENARVETGMIPVRISLTSGQNLLLGPESAIRLAGKRISVFKGFAQLDAVGEYSLDGPLKNGLAAGFDASLLEKTKDIQRLSETLRELRPLSQRP